ncbi:MAG: hypothetical protein A2817_03735 [Candidatus Yanofskybacteria bacterium RIFCSPHIGHO2_01_FULL_39_8b]|uniref:Type 4 fimbrial biogenesis protein PilX N-terminal domain-containing protein n=1 Tax=Candidatus Yanofskybacteria bacterium RIFCSPHIGHO2_01_FULL_39_8b TaxID=1802659 RepID=A0A1F8EEI5_9BACT|nr:MAG: hypothetical protein A2817_03735 [Candidatus Yanofskybacteria bacterium RIFCSPHIGHO2_01_FULL_39_8b]
MIEFLKFKKSENGQLSLAVLLLGTVAIIIISGLIIWVDSNYRSVFRYSSQKTAFMVAEAGIEYYRWHLAHAPKDFKDGTGGPGPYIHEYRDKNGIVVGNFTLEITPPLANSSVVTIKSTGKVLSDSNVERIIQVKMGIPSVVKYAVLSNSDIRFELGTKIVGPVHSNGGIRFDGIAENIVTSAKTTYNDPDHSGGDEYAVHTHTVPVDPSPPASLPVRADVFYAGREFPVSRVDFNGLTETLAQIKSMAQSGGRYFNKSNAKGYHIVLKENDTFDIYKVKKIMKKPDKSCKNSLKQKGWKVWSIKTGSGSEQLVGNYPIPANGIIFVEDHVWVDGKINTARVTIAAGKFPFEPNKYKNITVNKDILYTNYDGQDVIGLISQGNVLVGMASEEDLRIDAAVVAQNGMVGRYYYKPATSKPNCSPYNNRQKIFLNGMIATQKGYGFAYSDGSGYQQRDIVYDSNLLYNPPPGFPFIGSYYELISWEQIK